MSNKPGKGKHAQPRLRVLAGPNGSGKSTIKSELDPKWIGVFVNADDMERALTATGGFLNLVDLGIDGKTSGALRRIKQSLKKSGLEKRVDLPALLAEIELDKHMTLWVPGPYDSYLASALAEAIREELLERKQTFTFETVMSHASKLEFMEKARSRGYRVYLYFVATDDPRINIDRVHRRVMQGGHAVDSRKVIERYHKSIALMTRACEIAHRSYIFDNSGSKHKLLAEVTDFESIRLEASVISPWLLNTDLWRDFA